MGTSQNQGGNMRQQGDFGGQQGFQDQSGLGSQSGYGTQPAYQGNTTDANTFGTGDIGGTGRMSSQHHGTGDDFTQGSQQGLDNAGTQSGAGGFNNDYDNDANNFGSGGQPGQQQHNKPSMGDKLKGLYTRYFRTCLRSLTSSGSSQVGWRSSLARSAATKAWSNAAKSARLVYCTFSFIL